MKQLLAHRPSPKVLRKRWMLKALMYIKQKLPSTMTVKVQIFPQPLHLFMTEGSGLTNHFLPQAFTPSEAS